MVHKGKVGDAAVMHPRPTGVSQLANAAETRYDTAEEVALPRRRGS